METSKKHRQSQLVTMCRSMSLIISLLLLGLCGTAQGIITLEGSLYPARPLPKDKPSALLHPDSDTTALRYIATYTATAADSLTMPGDLFLQTKTRARADGANLFRILGLHYDSQRRPILLLAAYYATEADFLQNSQRYPTNTIYLFSPETSGRDTFSLQINNQTMRCSTATYLRYALQPGETLKLSKGGFTGARASLSYRPGKPTLYLMVFGGPRPTNAPLPPGTMGIQVTTGQIREMTDDYGQFLALILREAQ